MPRLAVDIIKEQTQQSIITFVRRWTIPGGLTSINRNVLTALILRDINEKIVKGPKSTNAKKVVEYICEESGYSESDLAKLISNRITELRIA